MVCYHVVEELREGKEFERFAVCCFPNAFRAFFAGENRAEQVWRGCLVSRVFKSEKCLCPWHKFRSEVWPLVWSKPYSKSLWNAASDVFFFFFHSHDPQVVPRLYIFNPSRWFWLCPRVSSHLFRPLVFSRATSKKQSRANARTTSTGTSQSEEATVNFQASGSLIKPKGSKL